MIPEETEYLIEVPDDRTRFMHTSVKRIDAIVFAALNGGRVILKSGCVNAPKAACANVKHAIHKIAVGMSKSESYVTAHMDAAILKFREMFANNPVLLNRLLSLNNAMRRK